MKKITLPLATSTWDHRETDALQDVIASGRFTMGPRVAHFERQFAEFAGSNFAVMVNSGSSANLIGMAAARYTKWVGLNQGDEVIVPAVSWATTYYPIHQLGLVPVLVDIDPATLNISVEAARAAVTPKTKAIFAVNLLGNPAPLNELLALAEEHGLHLFEDNCESLGATLGGKQAGTFGLFGTFSTFFSHHISTMEGGVLVTDDEALYHAMLSLRAHGWTRELPDRNHVYDKSGDPFDDLFRFVLPGFNVRPIEMEGALGSAQLEKVPDLIAGRRQNAEVFVEETREITGLRIQHVSSEAESSWFGFSMVLEGALAGRRSELVERLGNAGVEVRPIVGGNFARNPVLPLINARVDGTLSSADHIHDNGLFIGNHHYPIGDELKAVARLLKDFAAESG